MIPTLFPWIGIAQGLPTDLKPTLRVVIITITIHVVSSTGVDAVDPDTRKRF